MAMTSWSLSSWTIWACCLYLTLTSSPSQNINGKTDDHVRVGHVEQSASAALECRDLHEPRVASDPRGQRGSPGQFVPPT